MAFAFCVLTFAFINTGVHVELGELLELAARQRASDIFLKAGVPPALRLHGRIAPTDYPCWRGRKSGSLPKHHDPAADRPLRAAA